MSPVPVAPRPSLARLAALAVLLAAVAGGAWWWRVQSRPLPRLAGGNVLLITVDTLRADALGAYGNRRVETPWLDKLAQAGVRFDRAYAHTVVTLPSHANILTGRYPFDHGVRENSGFRLPSDVDTLATRLKAQGYRTGAFVSAFPLDSRFGLTRGFDVYDDAYGDAESHSAFLMQERPATETVARAARWLADAGNGPYFCWVHVYDPHFPYAPPEPFATKYRDAPYFGEVSAVDAALAPLLRPIVDAGPTSRTMVVVTGDHGESLGEHGEMTHGLFAYDATLKVPLLVHQPSIVRPGATSVVARHVDILPTVLDALGLPAPSGLPGRSLLPVLAGRAQQEVVTSYFEALSASLNRGWAPLTGVLRESVKYIDLPIPELYDLGADPRETNNLEPKEPERTRELQALRREFTDLDKGAAPKVESAETQAALRSLGYVTGTPARRTQYTDADDPKRLVGLDERIHAIVTRYQAGDVAGALTLCEEVVRERPDMSLTLLYLAFLNNELGHASASVDAARRALALNTDDASVAALLAAYLVEGGHAREAAAVLAPFVNRPEPDLDAVIAYGVARAASDDYDAALATFERARSLDPSNAMALVNIGTVALMRGRTDEARAQFEAALAIDPSVARAHNSLGVIDANAGRTEDAIAHWRRAVTLDPRDYQTLYNLATLLVRLGRDAEARPFFERYVQTAPLTLEGRDIARVRQWLGPERR
ncbi:MAG: sulfatase-like hydrolase/transferase [Vicinamibacterales bacterium]